MFGLPIVDQAHQKVHMVAGALIDLQDETAHELLDMKQPHL